MTEQGMHPAVFAGLLGGAAWSVPSTALAIPVDEEVLSILSDSLVLRYVVACLAVGTVAATVASLVVRHAERKAEKDFSFGSSFSSDNLIQILTEEPARKQPDVAPEQATTENLSRNVAHAAHQAATPNTKDEAKPLASAHVVARKPSSSSGKVAARHFATSSAGKGTPVSAAPGQQDAVVQTRRHGKHFAVPGSEEARKVEPVREALDDTGKLERTPRKPNRQRLYQLPTIESRYTYPQQAIQGPSPVHSEALVPAINPVTSPQRAYVPQPVPTVEVASQTESPVGFTGRLRIREIMASRTKGVRAILAERLNPHALDDVPLIARADGTVGEIAPSWFDQTLAPALGRKLSEITGKLEDTAERNPVDVSDQERIETSSRSAYIAGRIAEVNEGLFPERRSVDELEHDDVFEQALAAMGETIGEGQVPFSDVVGGPSTIDDPDGLEAPTGFIPFRVPAAHPEVVDTNTYVDYLLRDELSQNESQTLRNSSYAHLKVIEGGTSPMRLRRLMESKRTETAARHGRGRHFASPTATAEAL